MLLCVIRLMEGGESQRGTEVCIMLAQMKRDSMRRYMCQKMSVELTLGYNIIL